MTATLFARLINGELPARFVWSDPKAVAFLTVAPLTAGHALVVPRVEVDDWTGADDALLAHLIGVAKQIGRAQQLGWKAPRVGLVVAGFEIPHLHLHVFPAWSLADLDFRLADRRAEPATLDAAAVRLRSALRELGHRSTVPEEEEAGETRQ